MVAVCLQLDVQCKIWVVKHNQLRSTELNEYQPDLTGRCDVAISYEFVQIKFKDARLLEKVSMKVYLLIYPSMEVSRSYENVWMNEIAQIHMNLAPIHQNVK